MKNMYIRQLQTLYLAMLIMLFWPPIMLLVICSALYFLWHYPSVSEERTQAKNILMRLAVIIFGFYLGLVAEKIRLGSFPLYAAYVWLVWQVFSNILKLQRLAKTAM